MAELKAIPSEWRGGALRDGDGLAGVVRLNEGDGFSRVRLRYEYKRDGKKARHHCGTWPTASLDAIRRARNEARDTLRRGPDPNAKRDADRIDARAQAKARLAAEAELVEIAKIVDPDDDLSNIRSRVPRQSPLVELQLWSWIKAGAPMAKADGNGLTFTLADAVMAGRILR